MRLGIAERVLAEDPGKAAALITEARLSTEETMTELRDIIRGMYPPILADRGLPGAVAALAARSPVPVDVETADVGRLPAAVEAAAYFVIAEALTNVARHSRASSVQSAGQTYREPARSRGRPTTGRAAPTRTAAPAWPGSAAGSAPSTGRPH